MIVDNLILAKHSGLNVSVHELEKAYLCGVDVHRLTLAAIDANRKKLDLSFQQLVDADLDGRLAEKLGR